MILVTIGTTLPFDGLIMEVDRLVETGQIGEPVTCQIGNGTYIPRHCQYFRFDKGLDAWIGAARVVVAHGGTGTTLQLIASRKAFVSVANPLGARNHQAQFLRRLAKMVPSLLWTDDLSRLAELIARAGQVGLAEATLAPRLSDELRAYLRG